MKSLTIGIMTYNDEPFIYNLLYEIEQQVKRNPKILEYVDFWIYDDKSNKTGFLKKIPDFFNVTIASENSGTPSTGRNYLIDNIKSEYVLFVDGDDIVIRDIMSLVEEINSKRTDILFSQVVKIGADGQWIHSPFIYSYTLTQPDTELDVIEKICVHQTGIWSVYRVDFLRDNDLRYNTNARFEDNFFLYNILLNNPSIGVLNKAYYGWRINFGSFSHSDTSLPQRVNLYARTMKLLEKHKDNKHAPYILFSVWNQTYSNIIRNYPALDSNQTRQFYQHLEKVTNNHRDLIEHLKSNVDEQYVDKYFLFTKRPIFRSFAFINNLKRINRIRKSKSTFIKKSLSLFSKLPLNSNKVVMTSQYGQYGSNPKYLYKKLKEAEPDLNIKYFVKNKDLVDGKDFIDYNNKLQYYYHTYTAKVVYFDTWIDPNLKKVKGQKWVQIWHGYPYKKIYTDIAIYDQVNSEEKHLTKSENISNWDEVYALDADNKQIFENLFDDVTVVQKEYERIEWLIINKDNEKLKNQIRKKYNLEENVLYSLFAPTYRPYKVYFDNDEVNRLKKPGNCLLFNPHPMMKTNYIHDGIKLQSVDIQEILLICDELITDYSSIQYDFLKINDKESVKYYQPDIKLYQSMHGLYNTCTKMEAK